MNKKTKKAIVVLSIIAILIFLVGSFSFYKYLTHKEVVEIENTTPVTIIPNEDGGKLLIIEGIDIEEAKEIDETEKIDTTKGEKDKTKPIVNPKPPIVNPTVPPTLIKPIVPPVVTEPTVPEEPIKPNRPSRPSGGGGSYHYPASVLEIIIPEYSHEGTEFEVKSTQKNVKSLEWTVTPKEQTDTKDFMTGTLENLGGKITINKAGIYTITATAKNYGNSTYTFAKDITIYESYSIEIKTPKTAHTDKSFEVTTTLSDNVKAQLNWHIYKDGKEIKWQDYVIGTLHNTGGTITIKDKGNYSLTAVMYDQTSKEFLGKTDIEVLPVSKITLEMPKNTHTDNAVTITATTEELGEYNLVWSLEKDGENIAIDTETESKLTNEGGTIRFKEKGTYKVIATITDKTNRTYTQSAEIKVYPVASFSFALPRIAHTDKAVDVKVVSSELQNMKAEWSIVKDGKPIPPATALEGTLTNEGGSIRFKLKGAYTVKATLTDELGREYSCERTITVYPVAETGFFFPTNTHTDKYVEVKTDFKETDGLEVVWTLQKDGKEIKLADGFFGTLSEKGGFIKFKEIGSYTLKATVTDKADRSFSYTASTKVYPVIAIETSIPKYTHTDRTVGVVAKTTNAGNLPVVWKFARNDIEVMIENTLNNKGGNLSIKEKGDYIITAQITDETGRTFQTDKAFKVYPVPTMNFDTPSAAHTDDVLDFVVSSTDMENLTAIWYVDNTFGFQDWDTYVDGTLSNNGGSIRFKRAGVYDLQARVTDETGRVFRFNSGKIEILPVLSLSFELPQKGYTDTTTDIRTRGNNATLPVEWSLMKNGQIVELNKHIKGSLNNNGGKITFISNGEYRLTATMFDALGRIFTASEQISIYPLYNCNFTIPTSIRAGQEFVVNMSDKANLTSQNVVWTVTKNGTEVSTASCINGTLNNQGGTVSISQPAKYTLTATITDELGRVFTHTSSIDVINTAPNKPTITADVTRTAKNGKLLVNFNVNCTDPDGDTLTYEYVGKTSDNYYAVGTHTVKVRAKDNYGGISSWAEVTFTVNNSAPTRPIITRNPTGNSVVPGTPVTITASSTDSDGDTITYVWENRPKETTTYPLGKNTVRVKAVDSTGAESPWAAIVFFVMDNNGSGGMLLTGPSSTINENGLEGATITKYTFNVPAVSGHSGNDYGRVRGYNVKTGAWDQLSYGTTTNGISFTKDLTAGTYSKLEFYYYTNHNCMYQKSNITYTVEYYFE